MAHVLHYLTMKPLLFSYYLFKLVAVYLALQRLCNLNWSHLPIFVCVAYDLRLYILYFLIKVSQFSLINLIWLEEEIYSLSFFLLSSLLLLEYWYLIFQSLFLSLTPLLKFSLLVMCHSVFEFPIYLHRSVSLIPVVVFAILNHSSF